MSLSDPHRAALQAVLAHLKALGPAAEAGQVYMALTWAHRRIPLPEGYPWWSDLGSRSRGHWHLERVSLRQSPWISAPAIAIFEGEAALPWAQVLLDEPCPMAMPGDHFPVPDPWPEHVTQMSLTWLAPRWHAQWALEEAERAHATSPSPTTALAWQEAQWAVTQCSDRFQCQVLDHATFVTYWEGYRREPKDGPYETFENFLWIGVRQARQWFDASGRVSGEADERWEDWLEGDDVPSRDLFLDRQHVHPVWQEPVWNAFVAWRAAARAHRKRPDSPAVED